MATKKYEVGGMTDECAGPGGPGKKKKCRQKFKSKGASQETKGSVLGTIGAGILGALGYGAYKKYKKEQKGGATKYQNGGAIVKGTPPTKPSEEPQRPKRKNLIQIKAKKTQSSVDSSKWAKNTKAPDGKKYQDGGKITAVPGMKKSQAKAEEFYDKNPGVRTYTNEYTGKKIPTGPMTQQEYKEAAARAADVYDESKMPNRKKGGAMKKMKTGGMVNPNAKLQATKAAGSKGVKSGVNPSASASKIAKGRSGGTSSAPKTATPKAKYGTTIKKYGEGGGTKTGPSMYNIKQGPAKTPTGSTSTINPVEKAKAKYGMTVKRKK